MSPHLLHLNFKRLDGRRPVKLKPRFVLLPKNGLLINQSIDPTTLTHTHSATTPQRRDPDTIFKMAEGGGIDRRADEKMEFSTSKEVTVHPTFEAMSLKGR